MPWEEVRERADGVIAEVLVVDGVEEHLLDDVEQIRHLECEQSIRREQFADAVGHLGETVRMSEDVVRGDESGGAMFVANHSATTDGVKYSGIVGTPLADAGPRFQRQGPRPSRDSPVRGRPQQRAIVAADVDDQRIAWHSGVVRDQLVGGLAEVLDQPQ